MPTVDPGSKFEHDSLDKPQDDAKTSVIMPAENCCEGKTGTHTDNELAPSELTENGHTDTIIMDTKSTKTVNAHLVKNDVICLQKSPVKPVMIKETDNEERSKDLPLQNGEMKKPVESENSESKTGEKPSESCECKKPLSFKLLRREISKEHPLASRQRHTSEQSYKKQNYKMKHTNSDPTSLYSETVFEDVKDIKCEVTEIKKCDEVEANISDLKKTQVDVDSLADDLGSGLKIASKSENKDELAKKETEKEISELADGLQTSLHIKNQGNESDIIIVSKKTDVRISSEEIIIIKEEQDHDEEKPKEIKIKQEPQETEISKDTKDAAEHKGKDAKDATGGFSDRIEDNKKVQSRGDKVARGLVDSHSYQPHQPMQSIYNFQQQVYQHSGSVTIPSFQQTFIDNRVPDHQILPQRQHIIQQAQPPRYIERHQQHQQIIVPPSLQQHNQQPIIVPPSNSNQQRMVNSSIYQSHQNHLFGGGMAHYQFGSSTMQLQEPSSRRQPEENVWPLDDLSDNSSITSPYHGEDMEPISPASDFNQVNSPLGSQGSPHPSSPSAYPTVPTLSPEMPPVYSPRPSSISSPGSPHSQTIKTSGSNIGVVTINEPQSVKRQRLSESEAAAQDIGKIIEYLKQDSPESFIEQNPVSPDSVASVTPPPPTPVTTRAYQIQPQPSPPPGIIAAPPRQTVPPQYPYQQPNQASVPVQQGYYPGTQLQQQMVRPHVAVLPNQVANQQDYELQEWRQRVAKLSLAQLKEQDDDKDTVLHLAVIQEEKYLMMAIVEKIGRDGINMKNKQSQTALYLAAVTNQPEFVFYLIRHGADATIPAEQAGNTPLHYAAQQGFVEVIEAIMQGLDPIPDRFIDSKNFDGKSALHCAVEAHDQPFMDTLGNMETIDSRQTVDVLMRYGASATYQDGKSGKTALHYAIERNQVDIARLLLERCDNAGELVNCQMYNGNTALHLIVGRQDISKTQIVDVVWLLMSRGANVGIENAEKDTPGKLVQVGQDEVKKMLSGQAHGGR